MVLACDLQVDVNGEEVFFVDMEILSSFSRRLRKLFNTSSAGARTVKVIFHDFPGGPGAFELITRFCYNNGRIQMTPTSTCLLYCVAHFMEMTELIKQAEKSMKTIPHWSWPEILGALKQCQDSINVATSSEIFDRVLDSLTGRIMSASESSSPESTGVRFSCDTKSTKSSCHNRGWWFEDLVGLNPNTAERAIKMMVSRELDHVMISRFLFYYLKFNSSNATPDKKMKVAEVVINLLYSLDRSCVPCKGLFGILRGSSSLNLSKDCRSRLESMIGSLIDRAKLDDLLVPSPTGMESLYDVDLVLRFLKSFLISVDDEALMDRLERVGSLMDLYMAEVAPDSGLKPSKFVALATALPDSARDSHDAIYRAIDMYLEVHSHCLSEDEKMEICYVINYEKLSSESCRHLAHNSKFPSKIAVQALISQHSKLKSLFSNQLRTIPRVNGKKSEGDDLAMENQKLKSHLQGMQWRVMELEKICRKMQSQVAKVIKGEHSTPSGSRSLPRLCS